MPRVLLSAVFLEHHSESSQVRIESRIVCDSAPEALALVKRGSEGSFPGYFLNVSHYPRAGYDGKPLHQVEVTLSRFLLSEERQDAEGRDGNLSWEQRDVLRKDI